MSIIHDALKRVQQGLKNKTPSSSVTPNTGTSAKGETYFLTEPSAEEIALKIAQQRLALQNKITSVIVFLGAFAIAAWSCWHLYEQYKYDIPVMKRVIRKSFYQLVYKEDLPDFKNKTAEELQPLARITVNKPAPPPTPAAVSPATQPILPAIAPPAPKAAQSLDIHGVMSNGKSNVVLIDDEVYQEGDVVDGIKIIKINLDSIVVNNNGNEQEIRVKG